MANIERTASCPPQLSVESNEESCDEAGSQEVFNDLSPSVSNEVSPIKSSSEMLQAGRNVKNVPKKYSHLLGANIH